jgi:hypothetical protein
VSLAAGRPQPTVSGRVQGIGNDKGLDASAPGHRSEQGIQGHTPAHCIRKVPGPCIVVAVYEAGPGEKGGKNLTYGAFACANSSVQPDDRHGRPASYDTGR